MASRSFAERLVSRRGSLFTFLCSGTLVALIAIFLAGRTPQFKTALSAVAILGAVIAILAFWALLRSTDERERQMNQHALAFSFIGTLAFTTAVGFLQTFGFHSVSWLGIPALMIVLWSIGLVLHAWRYR